MRKAWLNNITVEVDGRRADFTVYLQKNGKAYDMAVLFDDLGHELGRTTTRHDEKSAILSDVYHDAYNKAQSDWINRQKIILTAINEIQSEEFLRGQFRATQDARELLALIEEI